MIFVDRSQVPVPDVLLLPRVVHERQRVIDLLSNANAEHIAQLRVTFDDSIWKGVKGPLLDLFNGKCAYCEVHIASTQPGDIEHFRPKRLARLPVSAPGVDKPAQRRRGGTPETGREHLYYAWLWSMSF